MLPDCEIIDAHHHLGRRPPDEFSGRDLIALMDEYAIQRVVGMHFVSTLRSREDFRRANDYVAQAVADHPGRIAGAVVVTPEFIQDGLEQISQLVGVGFRAVKLHPAFHRYHLTGGPIDEVLDLAAHLKLPVIVHSDFTNAFSTPYAIAALARRKPELKVVMAHLGMHHSYLHLLAGIVDGHPNLYLDTSQTPDYPNEVYAQPVTRLGSDRLIFGSDGPDCDPSVNLRKLEVAVDRYGLAPGDAAAILSGNASRVYGLDGAQ